jgi:hypothetical protein
MSDKWYNSKFAINLSEGIGLFLICMGIGTCSMLAYNTKIVKVEPVKIEQKDHE